MAPRGTTTDKTVSREQAWRVIRKVVPYLWPDGRIDIKIRVVAALVMLVLSKVIFVATPFYYNCLLYTSDAADD